MKYLVNSSMLLKKAVLCAAAWSALCGANAQELKIGYLDQQRIVNEAQPFRAASAKLEQDFSKRLKDLQDLEARLKSLQDRFEKDAPVLAESDRNKRQRELYELNKEYERKKREFQEDLSQRKNEEQAAVLERVHKVIIQISESEKYDLVVLDAPYHSARVDITDKVIKALNK